MKSLSKTYYIYITIIIACLLILGCQGIEDAGKLGPEQDYSTNWSGIYLGFSKTVDSTMNVISSNDSCIVTVLKSSNPFSIELKIKTRFFNGSFTGKPYNSDNFHYWNDTQDIEIYKPELYSSKKEMTGTLFLYKVDSLSSKRKTQYLITFDCSSETLDNQRNLLLFPRDLQPD